MPDDLKKIVANLLNYSFSPVHWEFEDLTDEEQEIVGSEESFKQLKEWVKEAKK